ncbi:MAG: hypothetical protein P1Q69_21110, partial [Candidatus Thorarchaeota archaeon]|nr:hypothetical protein [Candidatus Thorarchaeota archaeon]
MVEGDSLFEFQGQKIPVILITEGVRYETPKYRSVRNFIEKKEILRDDWYDALDWFFNHDRQVPLYEKQAIERIQVCEYNG